MLTVKLAEESSWRYSAGISSIEKMSSKTGISARKKLPSPETVPLTVTWEAPTSTEVTAEG